MATTTNTTTNTTQNSTGATPLNGVTQPASGSTQPVSGTSPSNTVNVPLSNTSPLPPMEYIGTSEVTPIVQLDKISGTAHNYSVVCSDNLFNGNVVEIGAITSVNNNQAYPLYDDGEVFGASQVSATSDLIGLVANTDVPPVEYIPNDRRYIEAGKVARVYVLSLGDVITVTNSAIAGITPTVGTYIVPNGYNLTVATSKPSTGLVLKCVGSDMINSYGASVLMVVQA